MKLAYLALLGAAAIIALVGCGSLNGNTGAPGNGNTGAPTGAGDGNYTPGGQPQLVACATTISQYQDDGYWGAGGLHGAGAASAADPAQCAGFSNAQIMSEMATLGHDCATNHACPGPYNVMSSSP